MASTQEEEFRSQQKEQAAVQGLTDENAVPEQRPVAFDQGPGPSELSQRIQEAMPSSEPMGKEAYERADSDAQRRKAEKASMQEVIHVGHAVEVVDEDSPHVRRRGAVVRGVNDDDAGRGAGRPFERFREADRYEVRFVGDERAGETVYMTAEQLKVIPGRILGRT